MEKAMQIKKIDCCNEIKQQLIKYGSISSYFIKGKTKTKNKDNKSNIAN